VVTVQYVRQIAYTRSVTRRYRVPGRLNPPGCLARGAIALKEAPMSTDTALTMEELELESAELLPSRETLCCYRPCCHPCCPSVELVIVAKICL
jgi:hypothetical protein